MNRLTLTFEFPTDGGFVIYSDNFGCGDMNLMFAGNQKEALEYVAKCVSGADAAKTTTQKSVYAYDLPYTVDEPRVTELRRTGAIS